MLIGDKFQTSNVTISGNVGDGVVSGLYATFDIDVFQTDSNQITFDSFHFDSNI